MLKINLLPEELRPRPRSVMPYVCTLALAIVVVVYCLATFVTLLARNSALQKEEVSIQARIDEVWGSVEAVEKLEIKKRQLNAKEKAIGRIMGDRIVWSKVLYDLAGLVPEDIWLRDLKEEIKIVQVKVPNPDLESAQKTITVPRQRRKFKVGGYALSPKAESGVQLVGELVRAMEASEEFSEQFRAPTPQRVDDDEFEGVSVKKFEIWTNVEAGGLSK